MIGKLMVTTAITLAAVLLGVACTQASDPTPTQDIGVVNGGVSSGGNGLSVPGAGSLDGAGFASFSSPVYSNGAQLSGIWVGGSGRVVVTPDLAMLSLGVEARGLTVQQARDDAATAMDRVMRVLTASGIEEKDIRTQFFNIQPEYQWNDRDRKQELVGYRVTNTVSVKVRDLEGVGILIDQVADAGGDLVRINNIGFTVENPEQFAAQAREAAVKDALAKARQFADLTGVTLERLLYIAESGANVPIVRNFAEARVDAAIAAPPTPISPGETDIILTVRAVFAIG